MLIKSSEDLEYAGNLLIVKFAIDDDILVPARCSNGTIDVIIPEMPASSLARIAVAVDGAHFIDVCDETIAIN